MRSLILLALASGAMSQNVTALLDVLHAAGLNTLATVATQIANTSTGTQLLGSLFKGPVTLLAPNDHAFTGVPTNISNDPELLAKVLSYHVIPGTLNASSFFNNSNTVAKTALNASDEVFLGPGGQNQAIAFKLQSDNKTHILNQNTPATIVQTLSQGNFTLNIVDSVIDIPGDFVAAAQANNLTAFAKAAAAIPGFVSTLNFTHGITIFAPTDAAFQNAAGNLTNLNSTVIEEILLNHAINGSVLYSTELGGANAISAGGEPFKFTTSSTGTTVGSGSSNATITTPDVIMWNGVLHIIDTVLINNQSNPSAASSALESATASAASAASVAATATTPSGPIGTPAPGGVNQNGSSSSPTSSGKGDAVALLGPGVGRALMLCVVGAFAGVLVL